MLPLSFRGWGFSVNDGRQEEIADVFCVWWNERRKWFSGILCERRRSFFTTVSTRPTNEEQRISECS